MSSTKKKICVGDIILVHSNGSIWNDRKGFIEEIIIDPTPKYRISSSQNPEHPRFSG